MVWIDANGKLYRGFGREYPAIVWCANEKRWALSDVPTPTDWSWGELVTKREAERCYPGSTSAPPPSGVEIEAEIDLMKYRPELFDFYDGPMYRKSPVEEAEDRRYMDRTFSPPFSRERDAEVQIARWFGRWSLPRWARWRWFLRVFWLVQ